MQHAINLGTFEGDLSGLQKYMLTRIHSIDYTQPWGDLRSYFAIEKTFTLLDWLIIGKVIKNPKFDMKQVIMKRRL